MYNLKILGTISPYCKKNMNCPGYMVLNDTNKILLDCGFGVSGLLDFPNDLDNLKIIISHYHKDHYADLFAIKYAVLCYERLGLLKTSVDVYVPKVKKDDETYLDYCLIKSEKVNKLNIYEYDESSKIEIDGIRIEFMQTYHSIKNYSVKMTYNSNIIVYSGDMGYKDVEKYIDFIRNANIFICECSFLEEEYKDNPYHLHTNEVAMISNLSGCNKVILTHTWPEHDKYEYMNEVKKHLKMYILQMKMTFFIISLIENSIKQGVHGEDLVEKASWRNDPIIVQLKNTKGGRMRVYRRGEANG